MSTDIQYFAAHYVAFKDNLTEDEKGSIIKWIKGSSDDQIKSLLMTGGDEYQQEAVDTFDGVLWFLHEDLTAAKDITVAQMRQFGMLGTLRDYYSSVRYGKINMVQFLRGLEQTKEKAGSAGYEAGKQAATQTGLQMFAYAAIAALVITIAYKTYKRFLSKAARACKDKAGQMKTSCMNKYKRDAMKQQIMDLNKGTMACKHTKNPAKCKSKILKKTQKLKAKLGTL